MANTTGVIDFRLSLATKQSVEATVKQTGWSDITMPSSECYNVDYASQTESITWQDTGTIVDGYLNGAKYYTNVTIVSTALLGSSMGDVEFAYFRHTGYRPTTYSDATCDTSNTSVTITCDANADIAVGQTVTGAGITVKSEVATVNIVGAVTSFTITIAATATATNTTLVFTDNTAPSTTANSTDHLEIRGDADDGFVVAVLAPGQWVVLPVQSVSGWGAANIVKSDDYYFQSVDPADLTAGVNSICMEHILVTAS